MDLLFTSLNKRQSMLLLTTATFGGQQGVDALDFLPEDQAELLKHRALEIQQVPRERRVPMLVQELKRLVKERRGMLWSADPERLAALLRGERGALVEVVLRALPAPLAEAVRALLPPTGVKLSREVRPQVLDIVRWKLEEMLARDGAAQTPFRFSDVLMMPTRELLTACDRLGARVLGPALAGLPEDEREQLISALTPDLRQLASKAAMANAPRRLPEEDARAQLEVHEGLSDLGPAIRGAGVQRLARACVAQSPEFAARMLERHRGDFGQLLARWVREERSKPPPKGDGGRADIVADLERLAARGYIDRPVRLPQAPPKPAPTAPAASAARPGAAPAPPASRVPAGRPGALPPPRPPPPGPPPAGAPHDSSSGRHDPMAERAVRRAGATNTGAPRLAQDPASSEGSADGSRVHRSAPRREGSGPRPAPGAPEVSTVLKQPAVGSGAPRSRELRAAGAQGPQGGRGPGSEQPASSGEAPVAGPRLGGGSVRVSSGAVVRRPRPHGEAQRPAGRVLPGRALTATGVADEETEPQAVEEEPRGSRPVRPGTSERGSRDGTR